MKLIILDRDGVINYDSPDYIKSVAEWHPIPGSLEGIAKLNAAGFTVAVATNQSGIGRGFYDWDTLNAIHDKLQTELAKLNGHIDYFAVCPHHPDVHCNCRKPKTGLLEQIAAHYKCSLKNVPCIGDSYRDLAASIAMDARSILVLTGNGEKTKTQLLLEQSVEIFADLAEAAVMLI